MYSWWDFSIHRLTYAGNIAYLCFPLSSVTKIPTIMCPAGGLPQTPEIMQRCPDLRRHQDARKTLPGIRLLLKQPLPSPGGPINSDSSVVSLYPWNLGCGLAAGCQRSNSMYYVTPEPWGAGPQCLLLERFQFLSQPLRFSSPPSPLLLEHPL